MVMRDILVGHTLAVGTRSAGAGVTLWDFTKLNNLRADPARYACDIVGRGLTAEEWSRLVPELSYERSC